MVRNNVSIILLIGAGVAVVIVIIGLSIAFFKSQDNINNSFQAQLTTNGSFSSLLLIQKIPIPNVQGRIDHMAADITKTQKQLFVAEIENNSLDVIDLNTGKRVHSINNGLLGEPQGVVFIPGYEKIFVSNGQDGSVDIFDAKSFKLEKKIQLPSTDADNMRYDSYTGLVYVGSVYHMNEIYQNHKYNTTLISYYNQLNNLKYDPSRPMFKWSMPFDYNITRIKAQPIFVHEEMRLPKAWKGFGDLTQFNATVNGEQLSGRSLAIDPFSFPNDTVVHFLVNKNDIIRIANAFDANHTNTSPNAKNTASAANTSRSKS